MQVILRKLSYKNQIVLPAPLLQELQIRPADILEISKEDKAIRIKKAKGLDRLYGSFADSGQYSIEELEKRARKGFLQAGLLQ